MAFLQIHAAPDDPADLVRVRQANEDEGRKRIRLYRAWRARREAEEEGRQREPDPDR